MRAIGLASLGLSVIAATLAVSALVAAARGDSSDGLEAVELRLDEVESRLMQADSRRAELASRLSTTESQLEAVREVARLSDEWAAEMEEWTEQVTEAFMGRLCATASVVDNLFHIMVVQGLVVPSPETLYGILECPEWFGPSQPSP